MIDEIQPKRIFACESELSKLHNRLKETRFPGKETVSDWSQGPPLNWIKALRDYWVDTYDWRQTEARLNALGSYAATIDGADIHLLHLRSPHENATPIIFTHGWPGSNLEFLDVADRLTNPTDYGLSSEQAFHVVLPSLPGFGFSTAPTMDWSIQQTARVWAKLMSALGYESYIAQGGDWGSAITIALAQTDPLHCQAIHLNALWIDPVHYDPSKLTPDELSDVAKLQAFTQKQTSYAQLQMHKPQKIAYALADSPIAQAAWILDIFYTGVDHEGVLEDSLPFQHLIDAVMMYWLPNSGGSSARFYWKNYQPLDYSSVQTPAGFSRFPGEVLSVSKRLTETRLNNLIYWNEPSQGGHFAALEQPALFTDEIRRFVQRVTENAGKMPR